ncbi:MAG: hypothetical protein GH150_00005 [Hadesarchaea archaeon]|nr:hypothetical protein [Hadesarchaea archaeon]
MTLDAKSVKQKYFWLRLTEKESPILIASKRGPDYMIRAIEIQGDKAESIWGDIQRKPFWASENKKRETRVALKKVVSDLTTERFDEIAREFLGADECGDIEEAEEAGDQEEDETLVRRRIPALITDDFIAEEVWDGKGTPRFAVKHFDGDKIDFWDKIDLGETDERGRSIIYLPLFNDHVRKGMVLLPREPKETTFAEVINDVFEFILDDKNFDPCGREDEVKLDGLISIGSWFLDRLAPNIRLAGIGRFAPILSMRGPSGSGKNRLGNLLRLISYRPFFDLSKTKIPSLFRPLDMWKGTLVLDEMDFDKTGETAELTHFLNCRATGTPIGRQSPDRPNVGEAFENFGLTIITQRRPFQDDATEGRTILYHCEKTERKMPTVELDETVDRGLDLQDKLLYLRMKYWRDFKIDKEAWLDNISDPRLNAALLPVLAMARFEPRVLDVVRAVANKIEEAKRKTKASSTDGIIINWIWRWAEGGNYQVRNMFKYLAKPDPEHPEMPAIESVGHEPIVIRDISDELNWKPRWVRRVINSLNLAPDEAPNVIKVGNKTYRPVWFTPRRLEKQLREFVPQYKKWDLFQVLRKHEPIIPVKLEELGEVKPPNFGALPCLFTVTQVTEVTVPMCGTKKPPAPREAVTEVTQIPPILKNSKVTKVTHGGGEENPPQVSSVTSVTTVTEPTTHDIIEAVFSFRGASVFKVKIAEKAGVGMDRLNVVLEEFEKKNAVIDKGAMVEVL